MINLVWLNTFCTLIETGHFTRTAEKLAMTQPGVSQHIQKLESYLGHHLIQREGKRFHLTETGESVYKQGRQTLLQLNELETTLKVDDPFSGRCRIASPGSVGLKLYPKILDWQQSHPKLNINYTFASNLGIEQALEERKLDIGLITRPSSHSSITCVPIAREQLCLVTSSQVTDISWESLLKLGYIDHPDGAHHASLLLGANYPEFHETGQFEQKGFSNQIAMILQPVARNLGFTVLPAHAVAAFPDQHLITSHNLITPVEEVIYLAKRQWDNQPARITHLIGLIEQELS
ncbi:LysR family transcriptional regulator [Parendozoicomonas haliclonae]|uniref:HTH-type transcriptional regulator CysL n=1 Tax=Parendozoicomonas haliclonae TaxID=1960125 RepID=A0A1X7ALG7_9GAMM|nr:LysR family transcriptional regulator [Parendozoicomonas haliclonae]SMA48446.1 HTH-type transcriptional regulator CysL [Parendozoicomonas haliclonae]